MRVRDSVQGRTKRTRCTNLVRESHTGVEITWRDGHHCLHFRSDCGNAEGEFTSQADATQSDPAGGVNLCLRKHRPQTHARNRNAPADRCLVTRRHQGTNALIGEARRDGGGARGEGEREREEIEKREKDQEKDI